MRVQATGLASSTGIARAYAMAGRPAVTSGQKTEASRGDQIHDELRISGQAELQLIGQLSESEQRTVAELKTRDRQVRAHEQAHASAAGPYARSGPRFQYQTGPDNAQYAVGGQMEIDVSPVADDPEATIRKAQVVRAAALAPSNPSSQDYRVAATATQMEAQAQQELRQQESQETRQPQSRSADPNVGNLFDAEA